MIYGERVRLRAIEREDLPRYVAWFNDPEVRQNLDIFLPMSQAEEERWYEGILKKDPSERPLAIDAREGKNWIHIGSCDFFSIDTRSNNAELGIVIGNKAYWGKGYGTDAIRTMLRHSFETLNLHRVFLHVFESNTRAMKVYRRVGFTVEGQLREDRFSQGRYEDTIIMGILRDEWQAKSEGKD